MPNKPMPSHRRIVEGPDPCERGRLFQQRLARRPFWMLVACIMVNRARWSVARPIHDGLMRACGDHLLVSQLSERELATVLHPLGFVGQRATSIIGLAAAWCRMHPSKARKLTRREILDLPGCGTYAADSYEIFVLDHRGIAPKDDKLKWYLGTVK